MHISPPKTIYAKDYTVPDYLIHTALLNFDLDAQHTKVTTQLTLSSNPSSVNPNSPLVLMGENLTLTRVALNGDELSPADYQVTEDSLVINNLPQQRELVLLIENSINPKANTALEGLYLSNGMLCTQCEAEGFRKITYFLDRPDVMTRFTTTLTADKTCYPVLLSNGNKIACGELADNRHWVTWEDPFNKPCYLFALVAGQLEFIEDTFTTVSGRVINLQIFVEAHDIDKCAHAMQSLKNAMRWDEQVYGREYDLDLYMIVAVGHFNMGAMENKGLNIFNTKFVLARPDTATDADYEHIEGVIAHEYFHNWTGNRITCRDWFQLSLKEGFTVFRDQEFTGDRTSKAVKRIEDVNLLRTRQFPEDAGPLAHPIRPEAYIEINNFYTVTVYEKGAEVVRMLHTLLGVDGFRKGCDRYFLDLDGQAVTCEHFVQAMESANNIDLTQFRSWYSQIGTPELTVHSAYDASLKTLTLSIKQSCPKSPEPLHIPMKLGLIAKDGSVAPCLLSGKQAVDEVILQLTQTEETFVFQEVQAETVVSLLRGFSAPVKLHFDRSLEELAFLLSHDSDSFNRWEAGQQLAVKILLSLIADWQQGKKLVLNPVVITAFKKLLTQSWQDLSYFSLLLTLPEENYLAEQMQVVDVDAIHQTREFVMRELAIALQTEFRAWYLDNNREESGVFTSEAIGRRRIKNTALAYLNKLELAEYGQWATIALHNAKNMTDQIAALRIMVNSPHPVKQMLSDYFYSKWQHEALVIDKWFAIQASSPCPETFAKVSALMQHPAFDFKNPNRVRSLIGAFSQNNPVHFHNKNGQGYAFLTDAILVLNDLNPQIASRMVTALTPWQRFDSHRQELMKAQLQRIMAHENISKDVYEIASKSVLVA